AVVDDHGDGVGAVRVVVPPRVGDLPGHALVVDLVADLEVLGGLGHLVLLLVLSSSGGFPPAASYCTKQKSWWHPGFGMHQALLVGVWGGPEFLRRRRLSLLDAVLGVLVFAFVVFVVEHVNQVGDGDRHPLFLGDDQGLLPVLVLAVGGVLVDQLHGLLEVVGASDAFVLVLGVGSPYCVSVAAVDGVADVPLGVDDLVGLYRAAGDVHGFLSCWFGVGACWALADVLVDDGVKVHVVQGFLAGFVHLQSGGVERVHCL